MVETASRKHTVTDDDVEQLERMFHSVVLACMTAATSLNQARSGCGFAERGRARALPGEHC